MWTCGRSPVLIWLSSFGGFGGYWWWCRWRGSQDEDSRSCHRPGKQPTLVSGRLWRNRGMARLIARMRSSWSSCWLSTPYVLGHGWYSVPLCIFWDRVSVAQASQDSWSFCLSSFSCPCSSFPSPSSFPLYPFPLSPPFFETGSYCVPQASLKFMFFCLSFLSTETLGIVTTPGLIN